MKHQLTAGNEIGAALWWRNYMYYIQTIVPAKTGLTKIMKYMGKDLKENWNGSLSVHPKSSYYIASFNDQESMIIFLLRFG